MEKLWERLRNDNRGSAMIMALTVVSLIAILGVMAMGTALLNLKMRSNNRNSDKNFYLLETALDEIYAQVGRMSGEILKEKYALVTGKLYQDGFRDNEESNRYMRQEVMTALARELDITFPQSEEANEEDCGRVSEKLKNFSDTLERENLGIKVESILIQKQGAEDLTGLAVEETDEEAGLEESYSSLILKGLCLTYVSPETQIESSLTVDLKIKVPYVRFINEGDALLDYILVANKGITVGGGNLRLKDGGVYTGNIYGGAVTIDNARVSTAGRLLTAAGNLTIKNRGELEIRPDEESGGKSRVWADGIELNLASSLTSMDASFFVKDDLTLKNNENKVDLSGNYYGYGNEGSGETRKETPDKSSAILLNDKSSVLNMTGLDSLILAGRAYLRFNSKKDAVDGASSPYIYPMGESLAVRATQAVYLLPSDYIYMDEGGGTMKQAGSNPVAFPEDQEKITLEVRLPAGAGGIFKEAKTGRYTVTSREAFNESAGPVGGDTGNTDAPAFLIALNGKIYFYYNFADESERSQYFEKYLLNNADSFDGLLERGKITGLEGEGGIFLNESGRISTSGSLYQVAGGSGKENLFELLDTRRGEISSSLSWVEFGASLDESFGNLKENLAETDRVKGRTQSSGSGGGIALPVANYVRLDQVGSLKKPAYWEKDDCRIFISKDDVTLKLDGSENQVLSDGVNKSMAGGLIVSAGNVAIEGDGSFDGLIISAGAISIRGNAVLTADSQRYQPLLESVLPSEADLDGEVEEISSGDRRAADYFYDYSDPASTVLNDYKDFVIRENWIRAKRENIEQTSREEVALNIEGGAVYDNEAGIIGPGGRG